MSGEKSHEMFQAYKKWKVYVYEDLHAHYLRVRIAEFEARYNFDEKIIEKALINIYEELIISGIDSIDSLINKIAFIKLPKTKKQDQKNKSIISNISLNQNEWSSYKFEDTNVLIDAPVELHIIATLFVLKSIKYLDVDYQFSYSFRPNFDVELWAKDKNEEDLSVKFFEKYYIGYNNWLNNAFSAVENHTKLGDNILLVSMDFKRFYYNIDFKFDDFTKYLLETDYNKFEEAKLLLDVIIKINQVYNQKYNAEFQGMQTVSESNNKLPLGMIYSPILANWYLKEFDNNVKKDIAPIYYGRYLDDILIAVNYILDQDKTNPEILKEIFFNKVFIFKSKSIYWIMNSVNHEINTDKIKIFNFDSKGSNALIEVYSKEIRENSSAFRFLPEDDKVCKDFQSKIYSMQFQNNTKKPYDIEMFGSNKFSLNTYLSSIILLINGRYNKTGLFDELYKEIYKYFFTQDILEHYELWEKLFTILVISGDNNNFLKLFEMIHNRICKIELNDEFLMLGLKIYLRSSVAMALSLNDKISVDDNNYDVKILKHHYRNSYLLRALYSNNPAITSSNFYVQKLLELNGVFDLTQDLFEMLCKYYKSGRSVDVFNDSNKRLIPYYVTEYFKEPLKLFKKMVNEIKKSNEKNSNVNSSYETIELQNYRGGIKRLGEVHLKKLFVGIVNFETQDPFDTLEMERKGFYNDDIQNNIIKLMNEAAERKCQLLVFPELAIPFQMYNKVLSVCNKNKMGLIGGLEYIIMDNYIYNLIMKVFPYQVKGKGKEWKVQVIFDLKMFYSPYEIEKINGLGLKVPVWPEENKIIEWNGVRIGSLNCYEAANIELRSKLKSNVDIVTISEHNQDLNYFENLCKSTCRDVHCYLMQANVSKYGDSQIIQPAKEAWEREIVKLKGDKNDSLFMCNLDIDELRKFQSKEYCLQKDSKEKFKPTPPGFDKEHIRKLLYGKE